jgi:hypothetical protein
LLIFLGSVTGLGLVQRRHVWKKPSIQKLHFSTFIAMTFRLACHLAESEGTDFLNYRFLLLQNCKTITRTL